MTSRTPATPSRWAWLLPVLATALVAGCEDSLSVSIPDDIWGFVFLSATEPSPGEYYVAPEAFFFRGRVSAVPLASQASDTCSTVGFSPTTSNAPTNVTYIDAGNALALQLGGAQEQLDRVTEQARTVYSYAGGVLAYNPGDSVVVEIPGAIGGFPQGTIRARTAEPFTINTIDAPQGTETIQLNWTPAANTQPSALVVSLRFAEDGATLNRQVLCAFVDDGADSITFQEYSDWAASPVRDVLVTRLRTHYIVIGDARLGVVSRFDVPTPQTP